VRENPASKVATPNTNLTTTRHGRKSRSGWQKMSLNRERVEHALNELLVRIVPEDADDSEDVANQRFNEAFDFAIDTLSAAGDPSVVPDVDHIAALIDRRGTSIV
jgi:hypothetical protein